MAERVPYDSGQEPHTVWEQLLFQLRDQFLLRERELWLLHEIDKQLLESERPSDDTFNFIVNQTKDLLGCPEVDIAIRRADRLITKYSTDPESVSKATHLDAEKYKLPFIDSNLSESAHSATNPDIHSVINVPIMVDRDLVAVFRASIAEPDINAAKEVLTTVGGQVAIAFQRARHLDLVELNSKVDRLVFSTSAEDDVVGIALAQIVQTLISARSIPVNGAQILFPIDDYTLEIAYSTDASHVHDQISVSRSVCGRAFSERRTVKVDDVTEDPDYLSMLGDEIRSEMAVPLFLAGIEPICVLNVESQQVGAFSGFAGLLVKRFADRITFLIAFMKLRSDVTEALEVRQVNDLLIAVGDNAANLFHELNNILGALKFDVELLRDSCKEGPDRLPANAVEQLDGILGGIERALAVPERVPEMLGVDQPTDINAVVLQTLEELNLPARYTPILRLDPSVQPIRVLSFNMVVKNLLKNAMDAMPDGGEIHIRTSMITDRKPPRVELVVRDTGPGIPLNVLNQIFDLRFTTKPSTEARTTGLGFGLWWVKAFVRRSGGEITARNAADRGAEFIVRIAQPSEVEKGLSA